MDDGFFKFTPFHHSCNKLIEQNLELSAFFVVALFFISRGLARFVFFFVDRYEKSTKNSKGKAELRVPFHEAEFWESEYLALQESFDWYVDCQMLPEAFFNEFRPNDKVLYVGSGTSKIPELLWDKYGVRDIICVDCSPTAIKIAKEQSQYPSERSGIKHMVLDTKYLLDHFHLNSFDVIIDKGLIDSLSCCEVEGFSNSVNTLQNIEGLLKNGGKFIFISTMERDSANQYLNCLKHLSCVYHSELETRNPEWVGKRPNEMHILAKI